MSRWGGKTLTFKSILRREGEFQGWPGEMYKERESQEGKGVAVIREALKEGKREPKLGAGRKRSGEAGRKATGAGTGCPGAQGAGAGGGGAADSAGEVVATRPRGADTTLGAGTSGPKPHTHMWTVEPSRWNIPSG